MMTSVRALEEDERFSWSDRNASAALVLVTKAVDKMSERGQGDDQMMLYIVGQNGLGP